MWTTILEWTKYVGICLLIGLIGLITFCVFDGDDVNTKTKTVYFVVLSELVAAGIALLGWLCFRQGNTSGAICSWVIAGLLAIGFAAGAVYGHKRDWKQD